MADELGNAVKEVVYDSFGNILEDTNPALRIPMGFAGGLHDPVTGLVRFGFRDYDPDTGRFTALDPLGYAGGDSDLYGYCLDDPVNLVDPRGLQAIPVPVPGFPPAFPPEFTPGTPENDRFTKGTLGILNDAGDSIGGLWEDVRPGPQGKFKGYDPNVDYNPSHHNDQYDQDKGATPPFILPDLDWSSSTYAKKQTPNRRNKPRGERGAEAKDPAASGQDDWYNLSRDELKKINKDKNNSQEDRKRADRIRNELKKEKRPHHHQSGKRDKGKSNK